MIISKKKLMKLRRSCRRSHEKVLYSYFKKVLSHQSGIKINNTDTLLDRLVGSHSEEIKSYLEIALRFLTIKDKKVGVNIDNYIDLEGNRTQSIEVSIHLKGFNLLYVRS